MRIAHVAAGFSIDYPGGVPIYVRNLATAQVAAGDEVFVVDGSERRSWEAHVLGFQLLGSSRRTPRHIVLSMPERSARSHAVVDALAMIAPDVVHVHHTYGLGTTFFDALPASGLPYVVSLHDYHLYCPRVTMIDFTGEYCGGPERRKCERCIGVLDQIDPVYLATQRIHAAPPRLPSAAVTRRNARVASFLDSAAVVLAVSGRVRQLFEGVYADARYRVVHIGNATAVAPRPTRTRSTALRLTMLGRLSPYKGSRVLADLTRTITRPDVEVRFWGRTDSGEETRAREAGVRLMGAYTPADLPGILADTDLGLALPVWEDNAPQVVMELLNYGVPVLATRMGGIPDFVGEKNGHLFDPTPEGITGAARWVDGLDVDRLRLTGDALPRLTTPEDHQAEVRRLYLDEAIARRP